MKTKMVCGRLIDEQQQDYPPEFKEEKLTWKEILFLIPLAPAIIYSLVYLLLLDFLMGDKNKHG